jgi:regulation of enolase protein 1 (concanavalin A-like superfamily)
MTRFNLPTIPGELLWMNQPLDWKIGTDNSLTITAGEKTDWFYDPAKKVLLNNAPSSLFVPPDNKFFLRAMVSVDFLSDYDAGAIQIFESDKLWAKLCFEYSPQKQPMIVSVVTRVTSDDCSSVFIDGNEVYLRIAQTPEATAFHYSLDGTYWQFVRYFSLGELKNLRVGFSTQSPTGTQCTAVFSKICYQAGKLKDKRSGE